MNLSLTSSPTASNFFDHVSELESFGNYPFVLETLSPNEKFDVHFSRIKEQVFEDFESSPQRQGSVSFQAEPAFEIEKTLDFDSVEAPRPSCHPSFPILTEKFSLKRTKDFKSDSDEPVLQASPCYEAKIGFYRSLHKEKEEFRTSAMSLVSFIQEKMTKGESCCLFSSVKFARGSSNLEWRKAVTCRKDTQKKAQSSSIESRFRKIAALKEKGRSFFIVWHELIVAKPVPDNLSEFYFAFIYYFVANFSQN